MSGLLIGHARVSTDEQDLTVQRVALAGLGVRQPAQMAAGDTFVRNRPGGIDRRRPRAW